MVSTPPRPSAGIIRPAKVGLKVALLAGGKREHYSERNAQTDSSFSQKSRKKHFIFPSKSIKHFCMENIEFLKNVHCLIVIKVSIWPIMNYWILHIIIWTKWGFNGGLRITDCLSYNIIYQGSILICVQPNFTQC